MADKTDSPTLDELFAEAFADDESTEQPVEVVAEVPVVEEVDEQSEEVAVPAKLSDLFEQPAPVADSETPTVDLAQEVTLPDGKKLPLKELVDGYLRREDYTQKTQSVAEEKKTFAAAKELYEMLQDDPEGTILALAQKVGIQVGEPTFNQLRKPKDVSKIVKGDDEKIAAIAEAKARELLDEFRKSDPTIVEAERRQSQARVQSEFDRIATAYNHPLDDADRQALVNIAIQRNEPNLEYLFLQARAALDARKAEAERVNATRVRKTSATPVPTQADVATVKPKTIEESFAQAELMLANR